MFLSFLQDGILAVGRFISTPFIAFGLGVFFTTFVALRAFYIQKRHERMADRYNDIFQSMRDSLDYLEKLPTGVQAGGEEHIGFKKLGLLIQTSSVYFPLETQEILRKMISDVNLIREANFKKAADEACKIYERSFEQLKITAHAELSPDLWEFTRQVCRIFVRGA
jgi:hypothetical protein